MLTYCLNEKKKQKKNKYTENVGSKFVKTKNS